MKTQWLGATGIALLLGSGAVLAQAQTERPQTREETPRSRAHFVSLDV
jgi:hypothetical protein